LNVTWQTDFDLEYFFLMPADFFVFEQAFRGAREGRGADFDAADFALTIVPSSL
jgi:hypothetical protein